MTGRQPEQLSPRAGPIIDADGHVVAPVSAWAALPEEYRPRNSVDPAGGSDPAARLRAMDNAGIDQAVLYPTIGLSLPAVADPAVARALATASNEWLRGYCTTDPHRLFAVALLPQQDPVAAARELHRAVGELGFVAGLVRAKPGPARALSDRAYDPVWEAAAELDVPIGIHEGSSVVAHLIAFGTLERHPGLRLVLLESSGSWAPFWLERLDARTQSFGAFGPDLALRPSEYFARQCAISFEVDEQTLPALAPSVGAGRIVWGSSDRLLASTAPGVVEAIRATVAPCSTATQIKVLGLNARGIYRLPARRTGPAAVIAEYFAAVTAQDPELLRAVFAADATFDVDGDRRHGHDEILRYYTDHTFVYEDFRPDPGPLRVVGTTVTVDIDVHLGGTTRSVRDVFETDGTRITALEVRGFADVLRAATPR